MFPRDFPLVWGLPAKAERTKTELTSSGADNHHRSMEQRPDGVPHSVQDVCRTGRMDAGGNGLAICCQPARIGANHFSVHGPGGQERLQHTTKEFRSKVCTRVTPVRAFLDETSEQNTQQGRMSTSIREG